MITNRNPYVVLCEAWDVFKPEYKNMTDSQKLDQEYLSNDNFKSLIAIQRKILKKYPTKESFIVFLKQLAEKEPKYSVKIAKRIQQLTKIKTQQEYEMYILRHMTRDNFFTRFIVSVGLAYLLGAGIGMLLNKILYNVADMNYDMLSNTETAMSHADTLMRNKDNLRNHWSKDGFDFWKDRVGKNYTDYNQKSNNVSNYVLGSGLAGAGIAGAGVGAIANKIGKKRAQKTYKMNEDDIIRKSL